MSVEFLGTGFSLSADYGPEEKSLHESICKQVDARWPNEKNLVISMTWFGPQFDNDGWETLVSYENQHVMFDNVFLVATVDPPMLNVGERRQIKNMVGALRMYELGNFDGPYQFNFFSAVIKDKFTTYTKEQLIPTNFDHIYVNYNRKPKTHRVAFVKKLMQRDLLKVGTVTLGKDESHIHDQDTNNTLYLTLGEKHEDYVNVGNKPPVWGFGIPQDYYSLHRLDIWKTTFLYINAATEFNPVDDLFCQQDTFKPLIGLRPYVINGVQKTYRWLRLHGFKNFNHYWPHIDIENGDVHDTIIELIEFLDALSSTELLEMYNDMLPDLLFNKDRFFEFAQEQKYKMENLFK